NADLMLRFLIYSGKMVHRKKNQPQSPQRAQSGAVFLCVLCALCGFFKPEDNKKSQSFFRNTSG
ncbi:MAG: hypothetical protein Q8O17_03520, partial [Candidatus Methanoperedens sp.]|nr:hypothetical protein [Candidatus Methanoperedens sp.]